MLPVQMGFVEAKSVNVSQAAAHTLLVNCPLQCHHAKGMLHTHGLCVQSDNVTMLLNGCTCMPDHCMTGTSGTGRRLLGEPGTITVPLG